MGAHGKKTTHTEEDHEGQTCFFPVTSPHIADGDCCYILYDALRKQALRMANRDGQ